MESESQLPPPPHHGQDPSAVMIEGEAEHHPHKSVLKKVKDKAKKIKDTIKKHNHEEDDDDDDQLGDDPELHGAPMYDATVIRTTNVPMETNINAPPPEAENQIAPGVVEAPKIKIGSGVELEEDPHCSAAAQIPPSNYQSKVPDGGKEANVAPLVSQFDNMNIHKEPEPEQSADYDIVQEKPVKTELHTPTQNTIADKISSATQDHSSQVVRGQHLSSGGTVKEYLAEKLKPGDEDKALSEVITEVFTFKRERSVVEGSRVKESEKKREGDDDVLKAGVVDRLKDAVGAWLGKGTGLQTAQDSVEGTCVSDPISATNQVEKGEGA